MKRLVFLLAFISAQSLAFGAQAPSPTPVKIIPKTPIEKLHLRIQQQFAQVQRNVKHGKLTKDQGKSLKAQVEAIRKQEIAYLKANPSGPGKGNTKTLTDAQISDLNEKLNTLSKSIPIK